jgi:Ca2+-binding EF-hand superfamily protein
MQKFHKTIISLMIGLMVDKSELEGYKEMFKEFDTNNDGLISKQEFKAAFSNY